MRAFSSMIWKTSFSLKCILQRKHEAGADSPTCTHILLGLMTASGEFPFFPRAHGGERALI